VTVLVFVTCFGVAAQVVAMQREELEAKRIASERGAESQRIASNAVGKLMLAQASSHLDRVKDVHELPLTREQLLKIASEVTRECGLRQLHARLALVADDKSHVRSLFDSLLGETPPEYVPVISTALRPTRTT